MFEGLFGGKDKPLKAEDYEKAEPMIKVDGIPYQVGSKVFVRIRRDGDPEGKLESGWKIVSIDEDSADGLVGIRRDLNDGFERKDISQMEFRTNQEIANILTRKDTRVLIDHENAPEKDSIVYTVDGVEGDQILLTYTDPITSVPVNASMDLEEYLNSSMIAPPRKRIID